MKSDMFVSIAIALVVTLVGMELGARGFFYAQKDIINLPVVLDLLPKNTLHLDSYEMPDPTRHRHWRLRSGYSASGQVIADNKKRAQKNLGARAFSEDGELRINSAGFRGVELSADLSRCSILMIGDSVTFGLANTTYPNEVFKHLSEKVSNFEVINAGVEGYRAQNHLYEIDRYKALQPNGVTIMLGWNEIFSDTPVVNTLEVWWRTAWLYRFAREKMSQISGPKIDAQAQTFKVKIPHLKSNPNDASIEIITQYADFQMLRLVEFIDSMQAINSKIALITLPGLFAGKEDMNEQSYRKAHLPAFTNNPYVLLTLTEHYNAKLRKLALERGLFLIDLAKWSKMAMHPRHKFFYDSVHLTPTGLNRIAKFIAEEIRNSGFAKNVC